MLKSNMDLVLDDLVRPLSLEALEYFASGEIPLAREFDSTMEPKFIRLGGIMMIGATISFG
ncbi:hypothetical protein KC976_04855, partial [Candidatus Saccharibacteria bacterium]|nr:hypothetical protein [Candidatus Saccharibacteria bacterium]